MLRAGSAAERDGTPRVLRTCWLEGTADTLWQATRNHSQSTDAATSDTTPVHHAGHTINPPARRHTESDSRRKQTCAAAPKAAQHGGDAAGNSRTLERRRTAAALGCYTRNSAGGFAREFESPGFAAVTALIIRTSRLSSSPRRKSSCSLEEGGGPPRTRPKRLSQSSVRPRAFCISN